MFNYRFTALVLPAFLLLFLPALAAYPWQMPFGSGLVIAFLTLLCISFIALRYPGLLLSPLVFVSGLACDLFTRSPIGYWTLLFLVTLACARLTTSLGEGRNQLIGWLCFGLTLVFITGAAWMLATLYQFEWQDPRTTINGMLMALILFPLPILFLVGLEKLFIVRSDENERSRQYKPLNR